jgi:carboxymethylenebutenolidase
LAAYCADGLVFCAAGFTPPPDASAGIPVATVEALMAALAAANKPAEFKIYPGAPHGFHADYRASYRKEAADDAWAQMQAWFKKFKVLG